MALAKEEKMKKIKQDIKNNEFSSVYLLCGVEKFLIRSTKQELRTAIRAGGDDMNYSYFEGKGISVSEVIGMAETMPFFSDRRLIVIENSGFFKTSQTELAEYLENISNTSHIIFVESDIDKRGKMYKTVKKHGHIAEIGEQTPELLTRWMASILKKDGINITGHTASYILEKVGTNMEKLKPELEKLACYALGKDVLEIEDVDKICILQPVNKVFDMVDAMIRKNQKEALDYYYDLAALQVDAVPILAAIANHFKRLVYVKEMAMQNFPKGDIAKVSGINIYFVDKYLGQARHFKVEQLKDALEEVVDMERAFKSGQISDKLAVELLVVKYSTSC